MTVAQEKTPELKKKPEKKTIWTTEEKNNHQTLYGCDILVENGSLDDVRTNKHLPIHISYSICMRIRFIMI